MVLVSVKYYSYSLYKKLFCGYIGINLYLLIYWDSVCFCYYIYQIILDVVFCVCLFCLQVCVDVFSLFKDIKLDEVI